MPMEIRYWRRDGSTNLNPPGIKIIHSYSDFSDISYMFRGRMVTGYPGGYVVAVGENLKYLYSTRAGRTLIDYFLRRRNMLAIMFGEENAAFSQNAKATMTSVAWELIGGGAGKKPGGATQAAFENIFPAPRRKAKQDGRWRTFAELVNCQPVWDIVQRPGDAGGLWSKLQQIYDSYTRYMCSSDDTTGGNLLFKAPPSGLDITGKEMSDWMILGQAPSRLSERQLNQLRLATIVALEMRAGRGAIGHGRGESTTVKFNHDLSTKLNNERPPAIGLAHELVHAYFNARGMQPGGDTGPGMVLFEFRCVGIGPWEGAEISENAVRSQWSDAVEEHLTTMDAQNQKIPGPRVRY